MPKGDFEGEFEDFSGGILAKQAAAAGDTVVITDDGRLGVNTSNPQYGLDVRSAANIGNISNNITGGYGLTVGTKDTVGGNHSVAIGNENRVDAASAMVVGRGNKIESAAAYSVALGRDNQIYNRFSHAIGNGNTISSGVDGGFAIGQGNTVNGNKGGMALGFSATAEANQLALGFSQIKLESGTLDQGNSSMNNKILVQGADNMLYHISTDSLNITSEFEDRQIRATQANAAANTVTITDAGEVVLGTGDGW